jgi:nucleoside 2-deoxyribosyltransferase
MLLPSRGKGMNLKCFIASAFGKSDVDRIYGKVVKPLLTHRAIRALRVDRIEHNDDIDDKILSLIDKCDFAIADLTYARPSVYYEAGKVHGLGKPVIFTVRSDHLRDRAEDIAGNLRVHFDLRMKNIITWTQPNKAFEKRLGARLSFVTKPLVKQMHEDYTESQLRKEYDALSVADRIAGIAGKMKSAIQRSGFQVVASKYDDTANFISYKKVGNGYWLLAGLIETSFTGRKIAGAQHIPFSSWFIFSDLPKYVSPITRKDIFVVSLRKLQKQTIYESLREYSPTHGDEEFYQIDRSSGLTRETIFHIIVPTHFKDFEARLSDHLKRMRHR